MTLNRRGGTLVELLVTTTILGILASVVTLSIRRFTPPPLHDPLTIIADTLATVIESGRGTTLQFLVNERPAFATLNPDGSVIADSAIHIERLSAHSFNAR